MPISDAEGPRFGLLAVLICCLSLFAFAPDAGATETSTDAGISASSKPHRIYACVTRTFRTLNRSSKKGRCRRGETKISWNVRGRRGKKGARGRPGPAGVRGSQGAKGATGTRGATGAQGQAGTVGPTGAAGEIGATGVAGATGATGPQGSADTPQEVLDELLTVDGPGSGLNADLLDGLHAEDFWQVTGNASTTPATDFLGTTEDQPLNFRVNNARALRLEPKLDGTAPAPNVIGGSPDNAVTGGAVSATIAGGGRSDATDSATANKVGASGGAIGGGRGNSAQGQNSTIGGGIVNVTSGNNSTIAGGTLNLATGFFANVGGGLQNVASNSGATVGGGSQNTASGIFSNASGGNQNVASGTN